MSTIYHETDGSELKLATYWKAERLDQGKDSLVDIGFPERATAEEAIADANDEYATFDARDSEREAMQICEWTQTFDPTDGESLGSESTGRGYSVDRVTGKATPNF